MSQENTTITTFQFRLNGLIIPLLKVRPMMCDGIVDRRELIAYHDRLASSQLTKTRSLPVPARAPFISKCAT